MAKNWIFSSLIFFGTVLGCYLFLIIKDNSNIKTAPTIIGNSEEVSDKIALPEGLILKPTYLFINEWYIPYSRISMIHRGKDLKEFVIFASPAIGQNQVRGFGVDCEKLSDLEIDKLINRILLSVDG